MSIRAMFGISLVVAVAACDDKQADGSKREDQTKQEQKKADEKRQEPHEKPEQADERPEQGFEKGREAKAMAEESANVDPGDGPYDDDGFPEDSADGAAGRPEHGESKER